MSGADKTCKNLHSELLVETASVRFLSERRLYNLTCEDFCFPVFYVTVLFLWETHTSSLSLAKIAPWTCCHN